MLLSGKEGTGARLPARSCGGRCGGVRLVVDEIYGLTYGGARQTGPGQGRLLCHLRQIAMYVCHVVLRMSLTEIGRAYGCDRTTVGHACRVIEERRNDHACDEFVSAVERIAATLFCMLPEDRHEVR